MLQDDVGEAEDQNYSAAYYWMPALCLMLWENAKAYEVRNLARQVRCTDLNRLENRGSSSLDSRRQPCPRLSEWLRDGRAGLKHGQRALGPRATPRVRSQGSGTQRRRRGLREQLRPGGKSGSGLRDTEGLRRAKGSARRMTEDGDHGQHPHPHPRDERLTRLTAEFGGTGPPVRQD